MLSHGDGTNPFGYVTPQIGCLQQEHFFAKVVY
jgi:hypothetical protein